MQIKDLKAILSVCVRVRHKEHEKPLPLFVFIVYTRQNFSYSNVCLVFFHSFVVQHFIRSVSCNATSSI